MHVPQSLEALGCLCLVFDIIDSLDALLTCDMTSSLCKDLRFGFKVFLQLVHGFKFLRLIFFYFNYALRILLYGSTRTWKGSWA